MTAQQPIDFGFGEDEVMLRDSARKFFTDNLPADALHRLVAQDSDPHRENTVSWDADLWQQVVELGWTAVCVPERAGGIGMPVVAAVALAEEVGRAAFPSPLLTTLNASFVLEACGTAAADALLEGIAAGRAVTLATSNATGSLALADTEVVVNADGTLSGSSYYVQDICKVATAVVAARGTDGVGLYQIDTDQTGVAITPDTIIDLTRDQGRLTLTNVSATEVAPPGNGEPAYTSALPAILATASGDMVGAGEWLLQTTVEYVQTRVQFERPLGFFQAIKHPLVEVMIQIDNAKSLAYNAACAHDTGTSDALDLARMAKAQASDMAVFSGSRAVQFHGGIGFTWECYVQLFFKRQMHSQVLFGDARHHRRQLADSLIGPMLEPAVQA